MIKRPVIAVFVSLVILAAAACGDDDGASVTEGAASGSGSGPATCQTQGDPSSADLTVEVVMNEYSYALDQTSFPAGNINFFGDNRGGLPHEFVIAEGTDVPTDDEGLPDEGALGDRLIGEVPAFPGQSTCEGAFELEAGDYVMFCAITEPGGLNHFVEGMVTTFAVT